MSLQSSKGCTWERLVGPPQGLGRARQRATHTSSDLARSGIHWETEECSRCALLGYARLTALFHTFAPRDVPQVKR